MMSRHVSARRAGVSLVEILVVVSIIGLLIGLLLPAVQMARESSRRAACLNNLRQIGVACQNHLSTTGTFPLGINPLGYSAHAKLLPHLEQRPLYDAINFEVDMGHYAAPAANRTAAEHRVDVFLCRSDGLPDPHTRGKTNYAGNRGNGVQKFGYNGAFSLELDGAIGTAAFSDGTSNTAAFSEWILGPEDFQARDPERSTFATPRALTKPEEFDAFVSSCRSLDLDTAELGRARKGSAWMQGELGMTLYNHTMEINGRSCRNGTAIQQSAYSAGSRHGGAHTLFADGHVKLVKSDVSMEVWRSIGSRNGGETASID